jgi:membrane protease YdiL (CAAX protease family)
MNQLQLYTQKRPVLKALGLTLLWFVIIMLFSGLSAGLLKKNYGDTITMVIGHLAGIVFVLVFLWRTKGLRISGIANPGTWQIWIVAIIGTVYFAFASLYSFYGVFGVNLNNLTDFSHSINIILTNLASCIDEEFLFRGAVLYMVLLGWQSRGKGSISSSLLVSGIFALFHFLQVIFWNLSLPAVAFLILETFIMAIWWSSLVIKGGSIWPAALSHFLINAFLGMQEQAKSLDQPEYLFYLKLLIFSIPLGFTGIWLLARTRKSEVSNK